MRNASWHQGENEQKWKKKGEQEHIRHFHFVVVLDNGNCIGYFNEV